MAQVMPTWTVGQVVDVRARTWANINRPGGRGKITQVYVQDGRLLLDVKYIFGGCDKALDPCLIKVPQELGTRERKKRSILTFPAPEKPKKRSKASGNQIDAVNFNKENSNNRDKAQVKEAPIASKKKEKAKRPLNKSKTKAKDNKKKDKIDVPSVITVRKMDFASPITDKGAEDGRKYMLAESHPTEPSPSSLFIFSPREDSEVWHSDGEGDGEPVPESAEKSAVASEPNLQMKRTKDDDKDEESPVTEAPTKRVTLKSVVDREMKEASDFVEDVLSSKPGETKKESKNTKETANASPRQQNLMAVFLELMDHNEGLVEEENLTSQLNDRSTKDKDFTDDEIETLVQNLDASNRIMRCDGIIYWL